MSASICDASSLVLMGMTMEIREKTSIAARSMLVEKPATRYTAPGRIVVVIFEHTEM